MFERVRLTGREKRFAQSMSNRIHCSQRKTFNALIESPLGNGGYKPNVIGPHNHIVGSYVFIPAVFWQHTYCTTGSRPGDIFRVVHTCLGVNDTSMHVPTNQVLIRQIRSFFVWCRAFAPRGPSLFARQDWMTCSVLTRPAAGRSGQKWLVPRREGMGPSIVSSVPELLAFQLFGKTSFVVNKKFGLGQSTQEVSNT